MVKAINTNTCINLSGTKDIMSENCCWIYTLMVLFNSYKSGYMFGFLDSE